MDQENDKKICESDLFNVWKEYESIAMHFNELIIRLRTHALGGVAAISAIIGYISSNSTSQIDWGFLSAVFFMLTIAWTAICYLDLGYYNKLLEGSVKAILEIEKIAAEQHYPVPLNLSITIESVIQGLSPSNESGSYIKTIFRRIWSFLRCGRYMFYTLVFIGLIFASYISLVEHCTTNAESAAQTHSICRLTLHSSRPAPPAAE
jgi:hypothetical protein